MGDGDTKIIRDRWLYATMLTKPPVSLYNLCVCNPILCLLTVDYRLSDFEIFAKVNCEL